MVEGKGINFPTKPTLNYEQAKSLFEQQSVFFGGVNGVPVKWAAELLGSESVEFACNVCDKDIGPCYNEFWAKGFRCKYLTREGFYRAVAYANVLCIAQAEVKE